MNHDCIAVALREGKSERARKTATANFHRERETAPGDSSVCGQEIGGSRTQSTDIANWYASLVRNHEPGQLYSGLVKNRVQ